MARPTDFVSCLAALLLFAPVFAFAAVPAAYPPVRSGVEAPTGTHVDGANMRAIRVAPELLANLDQIERLRFLREWRSALKQD